jgi:hypothetical protein
MLTSDITREFLEGIKDFTEAPIEKKGVLFAAIKKEVLDNPDQFIPFFRNHIIPLRKNPNLQKYFKFSLENPVGFTFDLTLLHRERLSKVFNKVTKEETQESIKFLTEIGWNDEQFQREYGVATITLWRYQSGKFQKGKQKAKEPCKETPSIAPIESQTHPA